MKNINELYKYLQTTNRFVGAKQAVPTPRAVVEKIISNSNYRGDILVMYNVEIVVSLLYTYNVNPNDITFYSDHKNKSKFVERMGVKYIKDSFTTMKFDTIIGNPPYQDGTQGGGQNKIYNQIAKTAISYLKEDGVIAFVTPTSVLKKSKRFSLVSHPGLKQVDFTADDHFNVGINICSWIIDKTYTGDVEVIHSGGLEHCPNEQVIHDYSKVNKDFAQLYECLKTITDTPDKRMFKQNNFGPAMSKSKDSAHKYPLCKIDKGSTATSTTSTVTFYSSRIPYFVGKNKFTISMTKGFSDAAVAIGFEDYDVAHLTTEVASPEEIANIKSFVFSDYFIKHSELWKAVDGYGYNYALKYLPPFDKTIEWDNESVKTFLESFLSAE